jgi:hypothetical protein
MTFLQAVRAELAKVLSVRLWWVLLLILFGYIAFIGAVLALVFGGLADQLGGSTGPVIPTDGIHLLVYSSASAIGYVFPVLFGALATTAEFRHQSLTPTFLATPRRGVVLGAKLLVLAGFGALYGIVGLAASIGAGAAILEVSGLDPQLAAGDTWSLIGRVIVAMALWAVIGVGLGVLVPSQVAAIVIVLAFTQFLEPILRLGASLWEWTAHLGNFLPGAASDALVGSSILTAAGMGGSAVDPLEWWQGGLVLLAIALAAAFLGYLTTWRKDVT